MLIYFLIGLVLPSVNALASECSPENFMNYKLQIRPQIKIFLDQLTLFKLVAVGHTTDSLSMDLGNAEHENIPQPPKPFPTGLYKVIFERGKEKRGLMVQTESKVGHYVTIIPGKTDIGGYVQLFNDLQEHLPSGQMLSSNEIDYFVRLIYSRFCNPLNNSEHENMNKLKDMLLAIMFSNRKGIDEYHNRLIQQIKSAK